MGWRTEDAQSPKYKGSRHGLKNHATREADYTSLLTVPSRQVSGKLISSNPRPHQFYFFILHLMFTRQHITTEQYDQLSVQGKANYRDFFVNVLGNIQGQATVNGLPLMDIGQAMTYLFNFSKSREYTVKFSPKQSPLYVEEKVQLIDYLWFWVIKVLDPKPENSPVQAQ